MASSANSIECASCHHSNPPGTSVCERCSSVFPPPPSNDQATIGFEDLPKTSPETAPVGPGTVLNNRYTLEALLGQGGMGAVYRAHDSELDRTIAVKVIRPDLAGHASILERFKQELILARQITHRNVIRIFDLGSCGDLKFITMEFIDGRDLSNIIAESRLSVEESVSIIRQTCSALDAAHAESVIHRDLKPQNIMLTGRGRVSVMDFGLARSAALSGMTQTGAMMGTPGYMSPEQVRGGQIDTRSDLFSVGVIFYELLAGRLPYQSETVYGSLIMRTQSLPAPPITHAPEIPPALDAIVMKCLAIDPADRYQTAREVIDDLDRAMGRMTDPPVTPAPVTIVSLEPPKKKAAVSRRTMWIGGITALALALVTAGVAVWRARVDPRTPSKPVTVLVAEFQNGTGDSVFDGTLEPMLNFALEGAGFITSYNRSQAQRLATQIQGPTAKLDENTARLVAVREGVNVVVSGSLTREGSGYAVSAKAVDAVTGKVIATGKATASSKESVLAAAPKLAAPIRKGLGDGTPPSAQIGAHETFTAGSLEAAHAYAVGQDLMFNAKFDEARKAFTKASELDPKFGRAYASMAVASLNLGERHEGERYFKLAMSHLDRMTERERFRTRGAYYIMIGDDQKCVEEYSALVTKYPSDTAGHNNLALCYTHLRMFPKAVEEVRRAVEISPKHAMIRNNLALFSGYAGDFSKGEAEARAVQNMNPTYAKGFLSLAFAQIGQGQLTLAAETYQRLQKVSPKAASQAAAGLADLALYEGKFNDAVQILEKAIAADLEVNDADQAASKYAALAYTQLMRNQKAAAVAAAEKALAQSKVDKIRFLAARIFAAAGETARARSLAVQLAAELTMEPQVYAKLIDGELALKDGNARAAIKLFSDANKMLDTWIGRFDLGRAYLEAGAYTEADSEFDRCIARRGEVLSLFVDEVPTYGLLPPVYYYIGRVREGHKSAGYAESYKIYMAIRGKADEDPLLPEIRKRIGQ